MAQKPLANIANRLTWISFLPAALVAAGFFGALAVPCNFVTAEDWPRWRGPQGNGISRETRWNHRWPKDGPKLQWRANVGVGFSSMVVSHGRVFTIGNRDNVDTVWCLDSADGKVLWQHDYESPLDDRFFEGGPTSTPTIDGDRVYTLGRQGDLFCFQTQDGKVVWSNNIAQTTEASVPGWGFAGSPVVHGNLLLLNVGEAGTAVDKDTGELMWTSGNGEAGYMTPHPLKLDDRWYVLIASGRAYQCVDIDSGTLAWRHRWLTTYGCNAADPLVDGNRVFISSGYNRGAALLEVTPAEAKVVWANKELQNQLSSSVKIGDYVYGFNGNDTGEVELKCIDFSTGTPAWSHSDFGLGSLMASGDRLIILSDDGELVVAPASPKNFEPVARAKILDGKCWTVPVLANGYIYARSAAGSLVCIDVQPSTD